MNRPAHELSALRQRAEAQIETDAPPHAAIVDATRLLHELQVHQIELELQNDELNAANRALNVLRRRYEMLYEHAPVGYLTLSLDGAVMGGNQRAFEMLKRGSEVLVGRRLRECFDTDSVAAFDTLLASSTEGTGDVVADNLLVPRPRSVPIYVKAQCRQVALDDLQPPVILLALMDVSALKFAVDDVISSLRR